MLTNEDIEFMSATRDEVVSGRQRPIIIYYEGEATKDPITGEPIAGGEGEREVVSVVTEVDSMFKMKRELVGGVEMLKGDIWFSVKIDLISEIETKIKRVRYEGELYEVLAQDRKGIGRRNRWEFLGRRQS